MGNNKEPGGSLANDYVQYDGEVLDIEVWSLDAFRRESGLEHEEVFLLKIDAEGVDGEVLQGAQEMLGSQLVRVILWEYSQFYLTATDPSRYNLREVVAWLDLY